MVLLTVAYRLNWLDWLVIFGYLTAMALIGVVTFKYIKGIRDFFLGGRRFKKIFVMFHAFGAGTAGQDPIQVAGAGYGRGFAGVWIQLHWLICTPFYWLVAPIWRRMRYVTTGDFFRQRYGKSQEVAFAIYGLFFYAILNALNLMAIKKIVLDIAGGPTPWAAVIVIASGIMFLVYGLLGGIIAAIINDLIQGIMIILLSFIVIPAGLSKLGGFSGLHEKVGVEFFDLFAVQEFTIPFVIFMMLAALIGIVAHPHMMGTCGSAKSERDARWGLVYGNFLKRICTVGWVLTGVIAAALYASSPLVDREHAFPATVRDLLPHGVVGLFIACIIAAAQSTLSACMVASSGLFVNNCYRPYLRKGASERHYLAASRVVSAVVILGAIVVALASKSIITLFIFSMKIPPLFGIAWWFGVTWRKANNKGMWASFFACAAAIVLTWPLEKPFKMPWPGDWGITQFLKSINFVKPIAGDAFIWREEWHFCAFLGLGILAMILVSLLTKGKSEKELDDFYALLNTPVGEEDKLIQAGVPIVMH
jgi:Na+/proline symporter